MSFPISPVDGQAYNNYKYNTATSAWAKSTGVDKYDSDWFNNPGGNANRADTFTHGLDCDFEDLIIEAFGSNASNEVGPLIQIYSSDAYGGTVKEIAGNKNAFLFQGASQQWARFHGSTGQGATATKIRIKAYKL